MLIVMIPRVVQDPMPTVNTRHDDLHAINLPPWKAGRVTKHLKEGQTCIWDKQIITDIRLWIRMSRIDFIDIEVYF